ncbi:hypothetical protein M3M33_05115 [Loigolactobacillus coryniformis]|uniref:hypothetical protein n=1 Tax=Loigolactobacillus coryniformis TaxID=1610 RepID=UPI00201A5971|nr:hypothetical protein [Loigolactobacillus coryniformis]MCL5458052.1 hypothetical protein [Loigolactobacillus coryniformis]
MIILWVLSVIGAYYLGKDGIEAFFGLANTAPDHRDKVLNKWVKICEDDKKTARTAIHAVKSNNHIK